MARGQACRDRCAFPNLGRYQLTLQNVLLLGGLASSLVYAAVNVAVPMTWDEYSLTNQTVSELSAIGAPTRSLWIDLVLPWDLGAIASGRLFRIYTIASVAVLIVCGLLTSLGAPNVGANLPTPWIGVWERTSIGVFLLWVAVLSVSLVRLERDAIYPKHGLKIEQ